MGTELWGNLSKAEQGSRTSKNAETMRRYKEELALFLQDERSHEDVFSEIATTRGRGAR